MSPSPGGSFPSAKTLSHHLIQCQGAVSKAIPFTCPTALGSLSPSHPTHLSDLPKSAWSHGVSYLNPVPLRVLRIISCLHEKSL